jgi:hypothetical protein
LSGAEDLAGVLLAQLAAFLALLLAASAAHKALGWRRTQRVVRDFAGVPRSAASGAAFVACVAEALAGASLMVPDYRRAGAGLAAAIFAVYLGLIARAVVQRRGEVDCGCSFGAGRKNLGAFEVARNAALFASALMLTVYANEASSIAASQLLAACALLALYGALDQVMALQPMRRGTVL